MLKGMKFITNQKGKKIALQISLQSWPSIAEDIEDILVSDKRKSEKKISLSKMKSLLNL